MTGVDATAVAAALDALGPAGRADMALGALTTYRVGGSAAVGAVVRDLDDAARVTRAVAVSGLPTLVVGRGSNLLVADAGFAGLAVVVAGPDQLTISDPGALGDPRAPGAPGEVRVQAGAAVPLPTMARRCARAGVRGLEWAVGIPGSVGGAVRMNAGGHGADMAASLLEAAIVDLRRPTPPGEPAAVTTRPLAALAYGYRRSSVAPSDLVVGATFGARRGSADDAEEQVSSIVRWRRAHQPGGQNAGSVFTNPEGDTAGRLVDATGLKGLRLGTAEVSPKHANFIQADAGGSADDVRRLIDAVRDAVARRCGVVLATELRMVGFDADRVDRTTSSDPNPQPQG